MGPEHAFLRDQGRIRYTSATDEETLEALHLLSRTEGIVSALESAHAVAEVMRLAPGLREEDLLLVNLSGRGDKDVQTVAAADSG